MAHPLRQWWQEHFGDVVVLGDAPPEAMEGRAEAALARWDDRRVRVRLAQRGDEIVLAAEVRLAPELRRVDLRATVDENLEAVAQPPRQVAAPVELVDQPTRAGRDG